jgi:hypothetical protein
VARHGKLLLGGNDMKKFTVTMTLEIDDETEDSTGIPWNELSVEGEIISWLSDLGFDVDAQVMEGKGAEG